MSFPPVILNMYSISILYLSYYLIQEQTSFASAFINYDGVRIRKLARIKPILRPILTTHPPPPSSPVPCPSRDSLMILLEGSDDDDNNNIELDDVKEITAYNKVNKLNGSTSSKTPPSLSNGKSYLNSNKNSTTPMIVPEVSEWTNIMTATHPFPPSDTCQSVSQMMQSLTPSDDAAIESYWDQIMPTVSYLGTASVAKVKLALRVAYRAHIAQKRKSGEPFIIHPVEVSLLLAGLKMDAETVIAGLLHDTVEDTELTFAQVEAMFGPVVRSIVEGETKVSKLPKLMIGEYADEQAENLRQMFVAMTDDYRIIIVKLADRLHNMRTLRFMKPEKQQKISRETLDIFAPLAHRMGIWQFKTELEDTAFMYLYPREYKRLNRRLRRHQTQFRETLDKSQEILRKTLEADPTLREQATEVKVMGRTKELYSLWHKMETKAENSLDRITDVVALRVILHPKGYDEDMDFDGQRENERGVWLCYHVLGLVQHLPGFQPVPTKVKDYISFPKPNGYQSLHTALILNGQTVEVQIRTSAMHQVAEYGMAAHWAYTDEKRRGLTQDELYNTPWLESIKEWQQDFICSRDFVECVRRELLGKRVFVFLRNGKILNLVRGSTVIDAAFQIHTEVGLNMHGVEINGRPVPFSYELRNGDVVSILTGMGKPATDWMRFAKSRSTRSKLRSYFRSKQRDSLLIAGKILLTDFLEIHGDLLRQKSYLEGPIPSTIDDIAMVLPGKTRFAELDDLLIEIGKRHDREFLRSVASKLFRVPLAALTEAEEQRGQVWKESIYAAVNENRKSAKVAAEAVEDAVYEVGILTDMDQDGDEGESVGAEVLIQETAQPPIPVEFADTEHLCPTCLPIVGDDIVGTKPLDNRGLPDKNAATMVHRRGCVHAQRAINRGQLKTNGRIAPVSDEVGANRRRFTSNNGSDEKDAQLSVALRWSDYDENNNSPPIDYRAEIVVVANDRKLLLADCSEIVSEISDIVKTGSMTTNEHATLVFLVKVRDLDQLQSLMDALREVTSVMSVERRFGSELL